MRAEVLPRGGRRAPAPPAALPAELVRTRLLERAAQRFSVPLTTLVAGAGFGKSTLLAQAIRANQLDPRGVDAWVSCEPGDGDAGTLAAALVTALGGPVDRGEPAQRVLDALNRHAPVDVCLTIDDVHEVPAGSSGAGLLDEIAGRLPPHAHVVLAGRTPPPITERGVAAVTFDADDLAFTPTEVAALGTLLGHDAPRPLLGQLGGWPSIVRLAMSAPHSAPQFLWEEIVSALDRPQRTALVALGTLGWGTAADVSRVAGSTDIDLDGLVDAVPLIHRDPDGRYRVHQLWEEAIQRILPPAEHHGPRRRALMLYAERGETLRTGWRAIEWGEGDALRSAARHLVRETFGALPIDTAERWLAAAPANDRATPEMRLIELAVLHAKRYDDDRLDDEIDAVAADFAARGDPEGTVVALAFAAIVSHSRGDELRLMKIDQRARSLPAAGSEPTLRFLRGAMTAALASLRGDVDGALSAIAELSFEDVPASVTELVIRLHNSLLCLAGRADEAVAVSVTLVDSDSAYVRAIPNHARWLSGDASAFTAGHLDPDPGPGTNERYHFYHAVHLTPIAASLGDASTIEELRPIIEKVAAGTLDSRDRAMVALSTAVRHVALHDEDAARRTIVDHDAAHPADDRLADIHLRRVLPIAYVCDERVRDRWRRLELGGAHRRQQAIAEQLLAARAGGLTPDSRLPDPAAACTALPLVWSIELAARAEAAGARAARQLAAGLMAIAAAPTRRELAHAAAHGDAEVRRGAAMLLDVLPDPGQPRAEIAVLGDLQVTIGGDAVVVDDLRRRRVRMLLELLALTGGSRREQLAELIWPELDPAAAARNLRVTLSRLRRVLERGRPGGFSPLQIDGDSVALAGPPYVILDLAEFRRAVADADAAERRGDAAAVIVALELACSRWRGDPFPDIEDIGRLTGDLVAVHQLVTTTALRLGEQLLVARRFDDAAAWAERVRRASPYDERAHRLAVAAHLQSGDRHAVLHAAEATVTMLDELGVDPEPATRMLLRQAAARCGGGPAGTETFPLKSYGA